MKLQSPENNLNANRRAPRYWSAATCRRFLTGRFGDRCAGTNSAELKRRLVGALQRALPTAVFLLVVSATAGTIVYTHDAAGRLTGAGYSDGKFIGYTYDNAGNLTLRQLAIVGVGDSDSDGMDDAWEFDYFQTLARDGAGDFDDDGLTDLAEFLSGTLPNDPTSVLLITGAAVLAPSNVTIEWASVPGRRYQVQYADSLAAAQWTNIGAEVTATGTTSLVEDTRAIQGRRFYRVQLAP